MARLAPGLPGQPLDQGLSAVAEEHLHRHHRPRPDIRNHQGDGVQQAEGEVEGVAEAAVGVVVDVSGVQHHAKPQLAPGAVIVAPAVWGHSSIWRAMDGGWRPARIQPVRVAATGTPRIVIAR